MFIAFRILNRIFLWIILNVMHYSQKLLNRIYTQYTSILIKSTKKNNNFLPNMTIYYVELSSITYYENKTQKAWNKSCIRWMYNSWYCWVKSNRVIWTKYNMSPKLSVLPYFCNCSLYFIAALSCISWFLE